MDASQTPSDTSTDGLADESKQPPIPNPFPGDDTEAESDLAAVASLNRMPLRPYKPRPGRSLLMAGMIGLANGMGLDDHNDEIEIAIPFETDKDGIDFDFGNLPPL